MMLVFSEAKTEKYTQNIPENAHTYTHFLTENFQVVQTIYLYHMQNKHTHVYVHYI